jgi:hypothetical protein
MLFGGNKFHVAAPISAFANANLPEAIPLAAICRALARRNRQADDESSPAGGGGGHGRFLDEAVHLLQLCARGRAGDGYLA